MTQPGRVIAYNATVLLNGKMITCDVRRVAGCQGGHDDIIIWRGNWISVTQDAAVTWTSR